jgi:hypothetical protein
VLQEVCICTSKELTLFLGTKKQVKVQVKAVQQHEMWFHLATTSHVSTDYKEWTSLQLETESIKRGDASC